MKNGARGRHERRVEQLLRQFPVVAILGARQVGKSSLTGMRMLHHVRDHVPIWPFDPCPAAGSLVVEIYTSIAARAAGRPKGRSKMRDAQALNAALAMLGSAPHAGVMPDNHGADAIVTAAWMRNSARDPHLWSPAMLTPEIARTEGWTFGIV